MAFYDASKVEVLIDTDRLQSRIRALGQEITAAYPAQESLVVVCVLKGSFLFLADLVRQIDLPLEVDFIALSSYGHAEQSTGIVRMNQDLSKSVEGRHVLIVEDIVDTGLTMAYLLSNLATRKPKSLKVATLLHKPSRAKTQVPLDFVGFEIPDRFVIGYGLDYHDKLRNIPFIGVNVGEGSPLL